MMAATETEGYWFPLPEGWVECPLGELFEMQLGKMKGKSASQGEQFHYLKGRNLQWGEVQVDSLETMHFSPSERVQYELLPGDLLVCEYGEVGRCAIWSGDVSDCYFQNHIYRIRATGDVPVEYLRYFLEYATKMLGFARFVTQTSVQQISQSNLRAIPVPFNPSEVNGVPESMLVVDQFLESNSALINKLINLRTGIISSLLGNEIEGAEVDGYWTSLPEGWVERPLGELFDTQLGKMLDSKTNQGESLPYLSNRNVQWGAISLDDCDYMGFGPSEKVNFSLQLGDLLMCEGGEVGRCAIWETDQEFYFQKSIHRIRPTLNVGSRYLLYFFEYITKQPKFPRFVNVTSIAHLSQENLRQIPVHFPHGDTDEIEQIIRQFDEQIHTYRQEDRKLVGIRQGILFDSIQGVVSQ